MDDFLNKEESDFIYFLNNAIVTNKKLKNLKDAFQKGVKKNNYYKIVKFDTKIQIDTFIKTIESVEGLSVEIIIKDNINNREKKYPI